MLTAIAAVALLGPATAGAAQDPADQPPFGGAPVAPFVRYSASFESPPRGFTRTTKEVVAIAAGTEEAREQIAKRPLTPRAGTRGPGRWQVSYFDAGGTERVQVLIDDRSGDVVEAWTGKQVETKLARGYDGAVAGIANRIYVWLPLCALFLLAFFDPRRPFRLLHLDLLVMLGFGVSQFFFNRGEIGLSVPLVYPVLGYVFVRMLIAGMTPDGDRERREPLVPLLPAKALIVAIILLAAFRIGVNVSEDKVIDVGYAGVIGADRIAHGEDVYGGDEWRGTQIRGDVYGPANYLAYVPFELAFPWSGHWDDLEAAHAAAIAFDLLTALGLLLLGLRLRAGREGRMLGLALCFAWLAYPYSLYTLDSSFNDSLVALSLVVTLLLFRSPIGRGAASAVGGLTKFGTLALAPLFAAGDGERRLRSLIVFGLAFAAVAALLIVPALPDGGVRELYDRSLGYQASRGGTFSIWGLDPSLGWLHTIAKLFAVGLALLVAFVPRRRSVFQVAALAAAVVIALQVAASHWLYPYAVWFAPLVFVALFPSYRGTEAAIRPAGAQVSTPG